MNPFNLNCLIIVFCIKKQILFIIIDDVSAFRLDFFKLIVR